MKIASLLILSVLIIGCANVKQDQLYRRHIGQSRGYYDDLLVDREAYEKGRSYHRQLVDAVKGDADAAHKLFHNEYRDDHGEYGETWSTHCFVLLLKLGDSKFAALLEKEDKQTRKRVGDSLEYYTRDAKEEFPMTRGLIQAAG